MKEITTHGEKERADADAPRSSQVAIGAIWALMKLERPPRKASIRLLKLWTAARVLVTTRG